MFGFFKKKNKEEDEMLLFVKAICKEKPSIYSANDLSGVKGYEDLRKAPEEKQKNYINGISELIAKLSHQETKYRGKTKQEPLFPYYRLKSIAFALQNALLRKKLNNDEAEWIELMQGFRNSADKTAELGVYNFRFNELPLNFAIKQIEYYLKKKEASEALKTFLKEVLAWKELSPPIEKHYYGTNLNKVVLRLEALVSVEGEVPSFELKTEDIGPAVNEVVNSIPEKREAFDQIFNLLSSVSGAKPTKKFSAAVLKAQEEIGLDAYRKITHQLLAIPLCLDPVIKTITQNYNSTPYTYTESTYLCNSSQQFLKGIVWTMDRFSDKETIRLLSKLCEKSYKKIPGKGPAAAALGNACVYLLGNMRGKDGLGALSRLKLKVRQNNVKKSIDKYLLEGAKKYNVSVEELKEMAVPDFHLEKGKKTIVFDDYQLVIFIEGRKVNQQWIKPDGKPMKSVPSAIKNSNTLNAKLKEVRKEVKEIQKVYAAQKQRIDNQFILDRSWDMASFEKYYLKHGLVYPVAEKLIWTFTKGEQSTEAILLEGSWCAADSEVIDWIDESTTVKLWHPVNADEKTIIVWRERMMDLEWKQPIKQAFREIYILTDAEVNTITYSNRMAAHILKQHQFSSLANLRNWKYSLMGAYDDGRDSEVCKKYLPEYKITAEFWIDELYQDESWNEAGIWHYIATDQVKFKNENGNAMELVNVPKMVFTEIMRDVDMFVGVCSVGNDPQWMDNNGERQTNRDYWTSYSFGDLTEIAKTRKIILERLLPRLTKIRDKARIEGKFLFVKGEIRTYKIHIGSGNILMEPNDQYLCIVAARSAENTTDKIFIPFEGDRGLSIVLSKAFLLAEDTKITDTTITSQLRRG